MEQKIIKIVKKFEIDLSKILDNHIIDIIIHGSTVSGDFIEGKGDIDFLVFTDSIISAKQKKQIFDYHRSIRKGKTLASQLEGCYYTVNRKSKKVIGGIYLGTSEKGWKVINEIVNTKLDMANIMNSYYSTHKSDILNDVFDFTWKEIEKEIREQLKLNITLIEKNDEYSFKENEYSLEVYVVYSAVRSLYTIEKKGFISKRESLKWIMKKKKYNKYYELIKECSELRNPLTQIEIKEINIEKFKNIKELLIEIDEDIQEQTIR